MKYDQDKPKIHLVPPEAIIEAAKVFGFKTAIAHGMWTLSRAISSFVSHQENAESLYVEEVTCRFKKPVFLPNEIHIHQHCKTQTHALLDVTDRDDNNTHLSASVSFSAKS